MKATTQRAKTTYRVEVRRDPEDARFWLADVDGLSGAHTSSRSLATLDRYVREVIVLAADLPDDDHDRLELEWSFRTGDREVDVEAERIRHRRAELDAAAGDLAARTDKLARRLVAEGRFSVREAAILLGISPARIDQLVRGGRPGRREDPRLAKSDPVASQVRS
jgi:hypothetical protein